MSNNLTKELPLEEALALLGDASRLKILKALKEGHEQCKNLEGYVGIHVTDLTKAVGLSQSAVSQHLARLRRAGLVKVERKAQWAYYLRDEDAIAALKARIERL